MAEICISSIPISVIINNKDHFPVNMERKYRLICLKRSELPDKKVYWRANRAGYTSASEGAGLYTAEELNDCAGDTGDWYAEPVNDVKIDVFQVSLRDFS